jgi:hypothetical protein
MTIRMFCPVSYHSRRVRQMKQAIATVIRPGGRILLDGVRVFLRAGEPACADGWGGYFAVPVELPVEDGAAYQLTTDDGRVGRITVTEVMVRPDEQWVGFRGSGPLPERVRGRM